MTLDELCDSHGVSLAYFDNDLWPRPGIYIDHINVIFVNKALSHEAKKRVVYHELGHIDHDSYEQVRRIANEMFGNGLFKTGLALSFGDGVDQAKLSYLSALVEQNWILINQNQQIIDELKKLNDK